jgi:hypothetical protein
MPGARGGRGIGGGQLSNCTQDSRHVGGALYYKEDSGHRSNPFSFETLLWMSRVERAQFLWIVVTSWACFILRANDFCFVKGPLKLHAKWPS